MPNRHFIHRKYVELLDARRGTVGLPALIFAGSVRDLTTAQQQALNALLRTFEEHPRYATPERYLDVTRAGLEG